MSFSMHNAEATRLSVQVNSIELTNERNARVTLLLPSRQLTLISFADEYFCHTAWAQIPDQPAGRRVSH
jgi:hypothetical protein